jgi:hypothetical protein
MRSPFTRSRLAPFSTTAALVAVVLAGLTATAWADPEWPGR